MKTWQKLRRHPQLFSQYVVREQVIQSMREFFLARKFHEVEVPLLAPELPTESYYEVFETTLLDRHRRSARAFLTCSPEPFQKKLLVAGIGDNFTITKSFRNTETFSKTHNPEFTILEWYEVGKNYKDVMRTTQDLFIYLFKKLKSKNSPLTLTYQGQKIDLTTPWEKLSMTQAFKKYADIKLESCLTLSTLTPVAIKKGYRVEPKTTWEELFHQIYLNEIEPQFGKGRPTIIYDFPSEMAALAKKKPTDPRFAERFEIFIAGLELGDCYSELTDWKEQEERFKQEAKERKRLGKIDHPYDHDLIEAMKEGLPECSGLALGVDRTVMLFADVPDITETLFFPASEMWEN